MDLPVNIFKRALADGRLQIGLWSCLSSPNTVEVIAGSGFDWILFDTEHSPNDVPMVLDQLRAAVGGTAHPIVRPAWNDTVLMKRFLDIGVQTFLVPYVQNARSRNITLTRSAALAVVVESALSAAMGVVPAEARSVLSAVRQAGMSVSRSAASASIRRASIPFASGIGVVAVGNLAEYFWPPAVVLAMRTSGVLR